MSNFLEAKKIVRAVTMDNFKVEDPQIDIDDSLAFHAFPGGVIVQIPITLVADTVSPGTEVWETARFKGNSKYGNGTEGHMLPIETLYEKSLLGNGGQPKNVISSYIICNEAFYPLGWSVQQGLIIPKNYRYQEIVDNCGHNGNGKVHNIDEKERMMADYDLEYFSERELDELLQSGQNSDYNPTDTDIAENGATFAWGVQAIKHPIKIGEITLDPYGLLKVRRQPQNFAKKPDWSCRLSYPQSVYARRIQYRRDFNGILEGLMLASSSVFTRYLRQTGWPFLFRSVEGGWSVVTPDNDEDLFVDCSSATNPLREFLHLVNQKILFDSLNGQQEAPFSVEQLQVYVEEYKAKFESTPKQ